MNRKVLFGALIGLFLLAPSLQAQDDIAEIKKTITTMFDGMRAGDSSMVHSVMKDDVIFQHLFELSEGKINLKNSDEDLSKPHDLLKNKKRFKMN